MSLARVNQKPPLRCGHVASVSRAQGTMVTMPHRPQQRDAERHASEPAHCFRRICRRPLPLNGRSTSILVAAIDGEVARHRRQARGPKKMLLPFKTMLFLKLTMSPFSALARALQSAISPHRPWWHAREAPSTTCPRRGERRHQARATRRQTCSRSKPAIRRARPVTTLRIYSAPVA